MRKIYITILSFLTLTLLHASGPVFSPVENAPNNNSIRFNSELNIDPSLFLVEYKSELGLSNEISFQLVKEDLDNIGYTHHRYQQLYKGIKVKTGEYILHSKNGKLSTAGGSLVYGLKASVKPSISSESALEAAMDHYGAKGYWQNPEMEKLIQDIQKDKNASFAPKIELVLVDRYFTQNGEKYKLAWELDLYLEREKDHVVAYIDAQDGEFWFELSECFDGNANGVAETRYSGIHNIVTDSTAPNSFRLRDFSRNADVITLDANEGTSTNNSVDFIDGDNYWDTINAELDNAAYDVHWGSEMTLDYYLQKHNRNSINGNGQIVRSYVHWDNNWFNASWNGQFARYGDGNGAPLTAIDVVSHELTHGVTGSSAGLIYAGESGALNESFSDIFGTAVEFFSGDPNASWLIGRTGFVLRSMTNPNSYGDPDTYGGANWKNTNPNASDFGGVHSNSGVQNFWFYLLSEGGSGVNDNGDPFTVNGLGMDTAGTIAYQSLAFRLTQSSNFDAARRESILAAEALYGPCSEAVIQTAMAWYAVGVGGHPLNDDMSALEALSPNNSCDLSSAETMAFNFRYAQALCSSGLSTGDTVLVSYQIDSNPEIIEEYILSNTPNTGDLFTYTFVTPGDFSNTTSSDISYKVSQASDVRIGNNEITKEVSRASAIDYSYRMTFEKWFFPSLVDSFFAIERVNSIAAPSQEAKNTGQWGFIQKPKTRDPLWQIPSSTSDNFVLNQNNISKFCMCVDASNANNLSLDFDLKMTYSQYYSVVLSLQLREMVSNMRVTANGTQVGNQFHPTTFASDTFTRHSVNLDAYAGTELELCFESQGLLPRSSDQISGSIGDNTYLDNINVVLDGVSSLETSISSNELILYPNPAKNVLFIDVPQGMNLKNSIYRITNLTGEEIELSQLNNVEKEIVIQDLKSGVYILEIENAENYLKNKFIVE